MDYETIWYEFSPYLYVIVGVSILFFSQTILAFLTASFLVGSAAAILVMRRKNRMKNRAKQK
jgi:hypothetical protein